MSSSSTSTAVDMQRHDTNLSVGMNTLNADMYRLVGGYLTSRDFQALLHVNKHVHGEYIEYRYIKLKQKHSILYLRDITFRDRLFSLMVDPRRQLKLNFHNDQTVTDLSGLGGVHTLDLYNCQGVTDVSGLGGVHTLNLSSCRGVTDVSGLGGVHMLR